MWKFIKDVFGLVGAFFRFVAEVLEALNSGLQEVNTELEKFNKETEAKRLHRERDRILKELNEANSNPPQISQEKDK